MKAKAVFQELDDYLGTASPVWKFSSARDELVLFSSRSDVEPSIRIRVSAGQAKQIRQLMGVSTKAARALIDAPSGPVEDLVMAGMFKPALDAVANGEVSYGPLVRRNVAFVTKVVGQLRTASMNFPVAPAVAHPKCNTGALRRISVENGTFWGCSNYRAESVCDVSYPNIDSQLNLKSATKKAAFKGFKNPAAAGRTSA